MYQNLVFWCFVKEMNMKAYKGKGIFPGLLVVIVLFCSVSCKKDAAGVDQAKIKAPVLTYIVMARADKKGTNSNSEGTSLLKGSYNEETKILNYTVEYTGLVPQQILLKSGAKGKAGDLVHELYKNNAGNASSQIVQISGSFILTPLQERNLLKRIFFITVSTLALSPEISGYLTLKQN